MKKAKKSLSQNFIHDKNICNKIVNLTQIKNKNIIEIGPGYGFLTDFIIAKKPKNLYLIEKDNKLYNFLIKKYSNNNNINIINEDVLNFDFKKLENVIIISNLPYNISTKIITKLFKFSSNINKMIMMIQKEVAYKFDYNIEKLNKYKFLNFLTSIYIRHFNVSPTAFKPKPKVQSTVVTFIFKKNILDWDKIEEFTSIVFKNKRKKISNKLFINLNKINNVAEKRIDEIKIQDLLRIYNFF